MENEILRRRRRRVKEDDTIEMQMGPMIDMVFLLLVFFMVAAKPVKEESDIQIGLPGKVEASEAIDMPDEQRVVISSDGSVILNELVVGSATDKTLKEFTSMMHRFKEAADANKSKPLITLAPEKNVPHQRVVDVLNACAIADIRGVTFDTSHEDEPADGF